MKDGSVVDRPQRVVGLAATNIKRLRAIELDTEGKPVVVIGGRNAQGKSSVMDVIQYAMRGKAAIGDKPIRDGELEASAMLRLDDLTVERTFRVREDGTEATTLTVRDATGHRLKGPQAILEGIYNVLGYDPMAWDRMSPADQIEILKEAAGLDFEEIDRARDLAYGLRREANAAVKMLKVRLPEMPPDVPENAPTIETATARARVIGEHNRAIVGIATRVRENGRLRNEMDEKIEGGLAEIEQWRGELNLLGAQYVALNKETAALGDPIDPAEAEGLLVEAKAADVLRWEIQRYNEALVEIQSAEQEAGEQDAKVQSLDGEKKTALAQAKLPVKGLAWENKVVTYNGIPYPECSSAERIKITLGMGAAMNPNMPVICIREASLLDEENFALVCQFAEQHGLQVFCEVADDREGAVIIEDGRVVSGEVAP